MIPNTWENKKCPKPPTIYIYIDMHEQPDEEMEV
jgi:hypothetical protein